MDETSPDIDTTIDAIASHAGQLFPKAKSELFQIPSATLNTGAPEADLIAWLGTDYAHIQQEVNTYKNDIKDEFYLQATVGIIPSSIGALHKTHTSTLR